MAAKDIRIEIDHETGKTIERTGVCNCGKTISLMDPMNNECPRCHRWFNGSGSELAPMDQWEENWEED